MSNVRLVYVSMGRFQNGHKIGITYRTSSVIAMPKNFDIEKVGKLLSYLSDKVERENKLEPGCWESIVLVSHELKKYGFTKVEGYDPINIHQTNVYEPFHEIDIINGEEVEGCVDLFTVDCDMRLFNKTILSERYFDWYTEAVTENEIKQILNNDGR